jgi:hypothetical protein
VQIGRAVQRRLGRRDVRQRPAIPALVLAVLDARLKWRKPVVFARISRSYSSSML